ncbi:MAG: hypothetical protein IPJ88_11105 [Myxococcales bacterium]|nr:MAG: hypothetical protein IPJ88_11105 [Myxococcales bacterium]
MIRSPLWILCFLLGCGGSQPNAVTSARPGDPEGPPSIRALPEADVPNAKLSKTMQRGVELAEACLSIAPPPFPIGRTADELNQWSEETLQPWLKEKAHSADLARQDLSIAAEEQHRQRIMAGGIVALMHEDIAQTLLSIPMPAELDSEPDIAKIYKETIEAQARPYLQHARRAYRACMLNARGLEGKMKNWRQFCQGRAERLPLLNYYPNEE